MQRFSVSYALAGLIFSAAALGQAAPPAPSTANVFATEAQGNYERVKGNILKAVDKMPPESYSFKPTPDIRTFARVVNHVTEAQTRICGVSNSNASSEAQKAPAETADKATIVEALKASFVECDKAYAGLTNANMAEMLAFGPVKRTRLTLLWGNVAHDNEQYATLSLYLRLKGIAPPSSEK